MRTVALGELLTELDSDGRSVGKIAQLTVQMTCERSVFRLGYPEPMLDNIGVAKNREYYEPQALACLQAAVTRPENVYHRQAKEFGGPVWIVERVIERFDACGYRLE